MEFGKIVAGVLKDSLPLAVYSTGLSDESIFMPSGTDRTSDDYVAKNDKAGELETYVSLCDLALLAAALITLLVGQNFEAGMGVLAVRTVAKVIVSAGFRTINKQW